MSQDIIANNTVVAAKNNTTVIIITINTAFSNPHFISEQGVFAPSRFRFMVETSSYIVPARDTVSAPVWQAISPYARPKIIRGLMNGPTKKITLTANIDTIGKPIAPALTHFHCCFGSITVVLHLLASDRNSFPDLVPETLVKHCEYSGFNLVNIEYSIDNTISDAI